MSNGWFSTGGLPVGRGRCGPVGRGGRVGTS